MLLTARISWPWVFPWNLNGSFPSFAGERNLTEAYSLCKSSFL